MQVQAYIWEKYSLIDLTLSQLLDRMVDEFPDQYAFRYITMITQNLCGFRDDVDTLPVP